METAQFKLISQEYSNILSLSAAKAHLRLDPEDDTEDESISAYLHAAINTAENLTERILALTVYELRIKPSHLKMTLPYPGFVSVTSVRAVGPTPQELTPIEDYIKTDDWMDPATVEVLDYPADAEYLILRMTFATSPMPANILQGIKMVLGHYYDNRNEVEIGRIATQIPMGAKAIFHMNRYQRF